MQELHHYGACPLCASKAFAAIGTVNCTTHALWKPPLSGEIVWMLCDDCGHVFRNGYYTAEACKVVFSGTQESQKPGHEIELNRVASARMIDKVARLRDGGAWLDVGLGNGSLLMTAAEYGYEAVGLDLRAANVEAMQSLGIEAHCHEIYELTGAGRFAVVSMCDVLEHTAYPKDVLLKAHELMASGGVLLLSMPNMEAPVWRAMDGAGVNPYWKELEHCHNFGRGRLYALLRECGFVPTQYGISERYRACMEVIAIKG